jgi:hypothetical protein
MFAAPHTLLWLHGSPIYLWLELSICNCFCKLYHLYMEDEQCLSQKAERKVTGQAKPSQAKKKRDQSYVVARCGVHPHHQKLT